MAFQTKTDKSNEIDADKLIEKLFSSMRSNSCLEYGIYIEKEVINDYNKLTDAKKQELDVLAQNISDRDDDEMPELIEQEVVVEYQTSDAPKIGTKNV